MLTEEYLKDHFITAHFVDSERQNIEILMTNEDKSMTIPYVIPFDEEDVKYKALSTIMTVDQLHEATYQKKKLERKDFEDTVLQIAKQDGLIMDSNKIDTKFYPKVVEAIFGDDENLDHIFALKLAVFELDAIKDSKKEDLKKQLRQAKTKKDIIATACEILS
jgi:hypothetical protein|tara:strand:+ start:3963 stop:4451 length:489 start_codon:yes stop_codon:yes gene_type:complete